jgi:hypothetical protein
VLADSDDAPAARARPGQRSPSLSSSGLRPLADACRARASWLREAGALLCLKAAKGLVGVLTVCWQPAAPAEDTLSPWSPLQGPRGVLRWFRGPVASAAEWLLPQRWTRGAASAMQVDHHADAALALREHVHAAERAAAVALSAFLAAVHGLVALQHALIAASPALPPPLRGPLHVDPSLPPHTFAALLLAPPALPSFVALPDPASPARAAVAALIAELTHHARRCPPSPALSELATTLRAAADHATAMPPRLADALDLIARVPPLLAPSALRLCPCLAGIEDRVAQAVALWIIDAATHLAVKPAHEDAPGLPPARVDALLSAAQALITGSLPFTRAHTLPSAVRAAAVLSPSPSSPDAPSISRLLDAADPNPTCALLPPSPTPAMLDAPLADDEDAPRPGLALPRASLMLCAAARAALWQGAWTRADQLLYLALLMHPANAHAWVLRGVALALQAHHVPALHHWGCAAAVFQHTHLARKPASTPTAGPSSSLLVPPRPVLAAPATSVCLSLQGIAACLTAPSIEAPPAPPAPASGTAPAPAPPSAVHALLARLSIDEYELALRRRHVAASPPYVPAYAPSPAPPAAGQRQDRDEATAAADCAQYDPYHLHGVSYPPLAAEKPAQNPSSSAYDRFIGRLRTRAQRPEKK